MENAKDKTTHILNWIFLILILIGDICYIVFGKTWVKGITSALFVILGIINLRYSIVYKTNKFNFTILIGLFFAMLGDILLEIQFVVGAALFAIGHMFFFVSYCFLCKLKWRDFIFGIIICVPSVLFITLAPIFNYNGVLMEIVCVVYAIIISLMVGKAFSNYITKKSTFYLIILIGSALFFFSDLMLLLNVFANLSKVTDILCLLTYYPAEFLLAHSILHEKYIKVN